MGAALAFNHVPWRRWRQSVQRRLQRELSLRWCYSPAPDPMSRRTVGDRLVMSPLEPLVAGGAAEAFERQLQQLFRSGYRHLVVDLGGVSAIDSAGIRALVRGHTSAQRAGGTLRLAAAKPAVVRRCSSSSHLAGVFEIVSTSVEAARMAAWPWRTIWIAVGGVGAVRPRWSGPAFEWPPSWPASATAPTESFLRRRRPAAPLRPSRRARSSSC